MSKEESPEPTPQHDWTYAVPDNVVAAARSLLAFIDGTPPVSDVYTVALYILGEKALSFRKPTKDAGKQVVKVAHGSITPCPLCEELAAVYSTKTWFPGTHMYRCSSGHAWEHDIKP